MKYFGHDNVAILDGGVTQWLLEQKPASIEVSEPEPGNWMVSDAHESILAGSDDVAKAIKDAGTHSAGIRVVVSLFQISAKRGNRRSCP